ncbi:transposase [Streptomyces sp. Qhu-G9]|uniref:transposase n=1 Tax=Streptomyces sp. Qhu-G9 TaxID=3452799 RepID=UPI003AF9976C
MQKEPSGGIAVEPADHGLGRSRGGLTIKIHLAVEQGQKPLSVVITAGQRGDSPHSSRSWKPSGCLALVRAGRRRPDRVRADKAYDSRRNRAYLRRSGIKATIPVPTDRVRNRQKLGARGGRRRSSTKPTTASGMPSSAGSTASSATGPWPRDTTSSPSATRPPC